MQTPPPCAGPHPARLLGPERQVRATQPLRAAFIAVRMPTSPDTSHGTCRVSQTAVFPWPVMMTSRRRRAIAATIFRAATSADNLNPTGRAIEGIWLEDAETVDLPNLAAHEAGGEMRDRDSMRPQLVRERCRQRADGELAHRVRRRSGRAR